MVNSVRDKLDEADTVSEIRLMLGHDKDTVCVVVEGEDDQKLFRPLLAENVELFQSYASKIGVDNIVKHYFPRNKRVIGIRDKDYLEKPVNKRSFFCDYCCAEMMIIAIDSCFERLYCNFYKKRNFDSNNLRLHCLERLEKLSKLRQLNEQNHWNVIFDGIKPGKHYNNEVSIMEAGILAEINTQNPTNPIDSTRELMCDSLCKCSTVNEYLTITNGHDFVHLFCIVCLDKHSKTSIETIEATMRGTFGKEDFKQTTLYANLFTYQTNKKIRIVE
ncbi:MAG: hypothetical protein IJY79_04000 [Clostridia bacterium]|nr:hypothetical protein [Clostridia bacterium]